ncbi:MAG: hypothetical protein BAJALOKI1v1_1280003 [Promethearchaeota archaeon]|nr:MAG: hypothetical protein BAJALOKI1v1_1280003 [Candidatus Lokiarchaeota archaeon]
MILLNLDCNLNIIDDQYPTNLDFICNDANAKWSPSINKNFYNFSAIYLRKFYKLMLFLPLF